MSVQTLTNIHRDDLDDGVGRDSDDVNTLSVLHVPGTGAESHGRTEEVARHVVRLREDGGRREHVDDSVDGTTDGVKRRF